MAVALIVELDELVEIFGYKNRKTVQHAIRVDRFPIKTFKLDGRTVAHVAVVQAFFDDHMKEGIEALEFTKYAWDR